MSYDFLTTPTACDHFVANERLGISLDRQTLYALDDSSKRMMRPVNGLATVRLFIDGVEVPREHPSAGWVVEPDPLAAKHGWYRIRFNRPQTVINWVIEVSYTTSAAYCLKCRATSLVADFQVGKAGRWKRVVGRAKLVQRAVKFLMTGSCPFYPALVCGLRSRIARKATAATNDVATDVTNALTSLKSIQAVQAKYQTLDAGETLRGVVNVSASQDVADPRVIGVSVTIASFAGTDEVSLGFLKGRSN